MDAKIIIEIIIVLLLVLLSLFVSHFYGINPVPLWAITGLTAVAFLVTNQKE